MLSRWLFLLGRAVVKRDITREAEFVAEVAIAKDKVPYQTMLELKPCACLMSVRRFSPLEVTQIVETLEGGTWLLGC